MVIRDADDLYWVETRMMRSKPMRLFSWLRLKRLWRSMVRSKAHRTAHLRPTGFRSIR